MMRLHTAKIRYRALPYSVCLFIEKENLGLLNARLLPSVPINIDVNTNLLKTSKEQVIPPLRCPLKGYSHEIDKL
jgi:hypothetical protein